MEWSYFVYRMAGDSMSAFLRESELSVSWIHDGCLEVQGAQIIRLPYMERRVFSPDFIFIGYTSDLPADPQQAPHDCVCVEDGPLPEAYREDTVPGNLIVLKHGERTQDLSLLLNHINFVLADDFRYYRGLERITRNRISGCSLLDAVALAERLVTNPVILLDHKGGFLAKGNKYAFISTWLNEAERTGGLRAGYLQEIRNNSVYMSLREQYYSRAKELAWSMHRFLCVPVRVRGLEVAQLVVENAYSAYHWATIQLMEPLSDLLAEVIERRMDENNDRALLHNLLFAEFLRATPERETELYQRVEELGWKEQPGMRLLGGDGLAGEREAAFEQLRLQYPLDRWTVAGNQWLLLHYPQEDETPLETALAASGLRAGMSWPFDSLMRIPYALEEAKTAMQRGKGVLTDYAAVFAAHICTLPQEEAIQHLHPGAAKLMRYDSSHDGNLVDTLEAYLSGPDQPNEAAARLFISRSTLFYRINRIRELCGVELTTGEERMNLLLSLRLWKAMEG